MSQTTNMTCDQMNAATSKTRVDVSASIPAFARKYSVEQAIVATDAQCIQFLPSDDNQRFPVRITMRLAIGAKAPWYEIETYHVNVTRWVVRQTETKRELAFDIAYAVGQDGLMPRSRTQQWATTS
jgi:hypothetical protein